MPLDEVAARPLGDAQVARRAVADLEGVKLAGVEWIGLRSFSRLIYSRAMTSCAVQHCPASVSGSATCGGSLVSGSGAASCMNGARMRATRATCSAVGGDSIAPATTPAANASAGGTAESHGFMPAAAAADRSRLALSRQRTTPDGKARESQPYSTRNCAFRSSDMAITMRLTWVNGPTRLMKRCPLLCFLRLWRAPDTGASRN